MESTQALAGGGGLIFRGAARAVSASNAAASSMALELSSPVSNTGDAGAVIVGATCTPLPADPGPVPRDANGYAFQSRGREGWVILRPTVGDIIVYDEPTGFDVLHSCGSAVYGAIVYGGLLLGLIGSQIVGFFLLAWGPFAVLSYTIRLDGGGGSEPGGGSGWETTCLVFHTMFTVGNVVQSLLLIVLGLHRTAFRLLVRQHWPALAIKLFTNVLYSVAALVLQPHPMHVLWIIFRLLYISLDLLLRDVSNIVENLRLTPQGMARWYGKSTATKSRRRCTWYIANLLWMWFSVVLVDIFRHRLVMREAVDARLIHINITSNPFSVVANQSNSTTNSTTNNTTAETSTIFPLVLIFTIKDLADATFSASIILWLETLFVVATAGHAVETVTFSTTFRIVQNEEEEKGEVEEEDEEKGENASPPLSTSHGPIARSLSAHSVIMNTGHSTIPKHVL